MKPNRPIESIIALALAWLAGSLTPRVGAQSIAYNIRTTQLVAVATECQIDLGNCVRGDWKPAATINDLTHGGLIQCPNYDGWAVSGLGGELRDQYILWSFRAGCTLTDGMQILQGYSVFQYPFYLTDFALWYTTDPNPTLNSLFQPLPLTGLSGVNGFVGGNNVRAYPGGWRPGGYDYRVSWHSTSATGIRMHVPPTPGGYVVTEVSFRSANGSRATHTPLGNGCLGSNGVPSLRAAQGSTPVLGSTLTVEIASLPDTFLGAAPPLGLLGVMRLPAPIRLGVIGRPDCLLYISIDLVAGPLPTAGPPFVATWAITIPNDCNLIGGTFYQQGVQLDLIRGSIVMSNAAQATIGH